MNPMCFAHSMSARCLLINSGANHRINQSILTDRVTVCRILIDQNRGKSQDWKIGGFMEFPRRQYLNALIRKQGNGLIKVITGIRRCGKSYLLFTLFRNYLLNIGVREDHIIEMAFDSFENLEYQDPKKFLSYIREKMSDKGTYYILLDEVQELSEFEAVLNSLLRKPNTDIYVTGSNANFLSRDVITEFSGRGDEIHLSPLSFSEFMFGYDGSVETGWDEYTLYGGLPPVVLQKTDEDKRKLLKDLLEETYIRDITRRHRIRNRTEFNELMNILASGIGSLTNPARLSATFKSVKNVSISNNTIESYISYLIDAFLLNRAERYDVKGKRYIDSPYKYYYTDIGLRNAKINFRQYEETHIMENVVFNELLIRGYTVDVGVVPIQNRNTDGRKMRKNLEIDFVCNKDSERYYIQSALALPDEEKLKQELRPLTYVRDGFKKIILVKHVPAPWYTEDGIYVTGLKNFLLNPENP